MSWWKSGLSKGEGVVPLRIEADFLRCLGCQACVLACQQANNLPAQITLRRVRLVNRQQSYGLPQLHYSHACQQCAEPVCASVCPHGVYYRVAEGVVLRHEGLCQGCHRCVAACPDQAISINPENGHAAKCQLCPERRSEGRNPACLDACPTDCLRLMGDGEGQDALWAVMQYLQQQRRQQT